MSSDPSDNQATEEDGLLVEAVTLLVRRQRETEAWVAEQLCRAEEQATTAERRYAELDARLTGIEDQLSRLVRMFEPARGNRAMDERLARLREQLDGLKSEVDGRPVSLPVPPSLELDEAAAASSQLPSTSAAAVRAEDEPVLPAAPEPTEMETTPLPARGEAAPTSSSAMTAMAVESTSRLASLGAALGRSPRERFGLLMIGAGVLAVLYAVLNQLHLV